MRRNSMRHCVALLAAAALFVFAQLADPVVAQQQGQGGGPSAALDVPQGGQGGAAAAPQGRQGGQAGQGRQGGGRQGGGRQGGGRQAGPPPAPAPRSGEGRVLLTGATPAEKGLWLPSIGIQSPIFADIDDVAWQPWSRALYDDRQAHELEPHARCKASGVTRPFQTPYGVEFVELPELQRIYVFDVGGPHTFRTIYMDGRTHPPDLAPSYYGHSVGWWEGDTLVIDSTGFNESFWLDRRGIPHTERLRTLERLTRTNQATIEYTVTIDDPGAYTKPWIGGFNLRWSGDIELFEYVCQQANYAHELMVGNSESVDRSTQFVP
jgi:hypothetical protein